MTVQCSGGEIVINPDIFEHDCEIDPADRSKALCSSSGTLSGAVIECRGHNKDDLKLTATLDAATVSCEAAGASVTQMICKRYCIQET